MTFELADLKTEGSQVKFDSQSSTTETKVLSARFSLFFEADKLVDDNLLAEIQSLIDAKGLSLDGKYELLAKLAFNYLDGTGY